MATEEEVKSIGSARLHAVYNATRARLLPVDMRIVCVIAESGTVDLSAGTITLDVPDTRLCELAWIHRSSVSQWAIRLKNSGVLLSIKPYVLSLARLRVIGRYDAPPPYPDYILNPPRKPPKKKLSDRCPNGNQCPMKAIEAAEEKEEQRNANEPVYY